MEQTTGQNDGIDRGPMNALVETVLEAAGGTEKRVEETGDAVDEVVDRRDVPGPENEDTFMREAGVDTHSGS
jgi:hypothetical protein